MERILVLCTTDSMIWNFLVPHIKELEERGFFVECAASITGDFFNNLQTIHNIKMNEIAFERSPYKFANIKAYRSLVKLIKEKKYDTIFCHEPVGGAMGRLAGKKCHCKVIYMAHGFHFFKGAPKSRFVYYIVEKFLSRFTDTLITINQEDYDVSLKFHAKRNFKINGIGVDTSKFMVMPKERNYLKNEFCIPEDGVIILSVGELIPRKNHIVIIDALSELKNRHVFYFIAGDGELMDKLSEHIKCKGLENNVFLLGYRNDISHLCNSSDIFALPSIHEGLSVALMEAMACGKPVIGSKIRGNVDLISEGEGGYLVPVFDVHSYAEKISDLCRNEALRNKMGLINSERVKAFDISQVKSQLIDILLSEG